MGGKEGPSHDTVSSDAPQRFHTEPAQYTLTPAFLRSAASVSKRLIPVSDSELAFLVMRYLKENNFRKSYEAFTSESSVLTASLHSYYQHGTALHHSKPKTLWAILSEYLALHQESASRMHLLRQEDPFHGGGDSTLANPLALKMKDTFQHLSELVADYQAFRRSVQETASQQPFQLSRTQIPYVAPLATRTVSSVRESQRGSEIQGDKVETSIQGDAQPNLNSSLPTAPSLPVPQEVTVLPNNTTKSKRKSPFPKRKSVDQPTAQVEELASHLATRVNKSLTADENLSFLDLGDHQLEEITSMFADDARFKDLCFGDPLPYVSHGAVKGTNLVDLTQVTSHKPAACPSRKPPDVPSLCGKRQREYDLPGDDLPSKKIQTEPVSNTEANLSAQILASEEKLSSPGNSEEKESTEPALSNSIDVDAFLQTLHYT